MVGYFPSAEKRRPLYGRCCPPPVVAWFSVVKYYKQNPVIATSSTITFQQNPLRLFTALLVCTRNAAVFVLTDEGDSIAFCFRVKK